MIYWILKHIVVGPAVRVVFRPWVEGRENIPATGGAILASNHLSFSDSIFLPLMVERRVTFPAKQEYFTGRGVKGWLTRQFFTATGQIPIDRSGGRASLVALEKGLEVLRRGELFGIYPEGTRSPDGRLYRGKTGMARLAVAADVPIVPCAMIDTDKAQPTGQRIPNVVQVGIRIGRPLHYPQYAGQTENHEALREITDDVMRELQRLSGQDYVDEYASAVKKRLADRARGGLEQARENLGHARENIEQARDRARAGLTEAADRAREGLSARRPRHDDGQPPA
ncbi:acyl-phosphate glycerol 3-phosphate acyltransferase [Ornithinimicrobium sp. CNJ-824]|uniref:lysophospholipid acyltransferase family protein n=1 Tax=Ornithinimicrobium sp. CNJ-824 TaxID=1904966 RepID=UPI00095C7769|nr:lysophospholipid acyltransferase family protein [Ornithinimicrobium sp. CNJ-824]OLT20049.1 acyl-phosphate glycerol 3-phosphate acyltransferase [Ornithinimicrobium sp. CNJ-824]